MSVLPKYKNKKTGAYMSQEDFEKLVETKYDELCEKSEEHDFELWADKNISPWQVLDDCALVGFDYARNKMRERYFKHLHDKARAAILEDYERVRL